MSFELYSGEILGIAGESGSGKSTLSRLCMGLLKPDGGEIYVCGKRLGKDTVKSLRPKIQMVFQNPADTFNPSYSVGSGLRNAGHDLGLEKQECREKISELLKTTGLPESVLKRRPKELSGGQLQRLAIVRALLFISHDLAVIGHISDRVGVMYKGELVENGDTGSVLGSPAHEYTKRLLDARL